MDTFPLGLLVIMTIGGEEIGYDDDTGRPEYISDDYEITGTVNQIGEPLPNGNRQVVIAHGDDGEARTWGWLSDVRIIDPYASEPHTAELASLPDDVRPEDTEPGGIDYAEPLCEHGLSAIYCAGPMHWYDDDI